MSVPVQNRAVSTDTDACAGLQHLLSFKLISGRKRPNLCACCQETPGAQRLRLQQSIFDSSVRKKISAVSTELRLLLHAVIPCLLLTLGAGDSSLLEKH